MGIEIPETLKVGGFNYAVKTGYGFKERHDVRGQADQNLLEVRLGGTDPGGNTYDESVIGATFVHEIMHCIDYVYNNDCLDEAVLERLSNGIYQVLVDNFTILVKGSPDGSKGESACAAG